MIFAGVYLDLRAWMREAQGQRGDVFEGVQVAGLDGHVSRSAVYLIHKGSGRRRADDWRMNPQGVFL